MILPQLVIAKPSAFCSKCWLFMFSVQFDQIMLNYTLIWTFNAYESKTQGV